MITTFTLPCKFDSARVIMAISTFLRLLTPYGRSLNMNAYYWGIFLGLKLSKRKNSCKNIFNKNYV